MRTNRLARRSAAFLALGALALLAGCGGGSSSSGSTSASPGSYLAAVTRAADATDAVPGYKYTLTSTASAAGKSFTAQGAGTIAARGDEGTLTLEVEGTKLTELIVKPYVYIELPGEAQTKLAHGKRWARADVETFSQSYGANSLGGGSQDPAQVLGYLRSAGTVTRVGAEDVRGVGSTHYHAIAELDRLDATATSAADRAVLRRAAALLERATGSKTMPIDVWVGADGRVTRTAFSLSLCLPEGRLQESFSMDLYDYGRQPVVSPPPASEVADVDPLLKAEVAKGLAQLSCK